MVEKNRLASLIYIFFLPLFPNYVYKSLGLHWYSDYIYDV